MATSLVAQTVKRLPTMWETWVQSLGQEDPLEKEMATHTSILAWKFPWMEEPGRLQSMGSPRLRLDCVIWLHFTSLLRAVLMLLCYIRTLWVQCAGIFFINSFPTSDFGFTHLFNFCSSLFSLYSKAYLSPVIISKPLQQLSLDHMLSIYYS